MAEIDADIPVFDKPAFYAFHRLMAGVYTNKTPLPGV